MSGHLQKIRESRGLTRRAVSIELGMTEKQLERWEKGKSPVKRLHLLALASLYEVPLDQLEEGTEVAA